MSGAIVNGGGAMHCAPFHNTMEVPKYAVTYITQIVRFVTSSLAFAARWPRR